MSTPVTVKPRTRAGTYEQFERRYKPIPLPNGEMIRAWNQIPQHKSANYVWTVLDCDGKLYVVPGFHTVNFFGRVLCELPWGPVEEQNPGYLW